MIWPAMLFNLCVALLGAAYLLRTVRRFERRADEIMAKMDEADAASERKFNAARDEIIASLRAKTDLAIAELAAMAGPAPAAPGDTANGVHMPAAPSPDRVADAPRTDSPTP